MASPLLVSFLCGEKIRNSNIEIRNKFKIRKTQIQNTWHIQWLDSSNNPVFVLSFLFLSFEFVSYFELRIYGSAALSKVHPKSIDHQRSYRGVAGRPCQRHPP